MGSRESYGTNPAPLESSALWHPYTALPDPGPRHLISRASGAYLFDSDGKSYFDATSSWWCQLHGHCHPKLVEALTRQASTLDQILPAPHAHPVALDLADALVDKLGGEFEKVFFSDDGSTAVEAALKMALQYWQLQGQKKRRRFLSLELGYHGDTLGAVSVSHVSEFHHYFDHLNARTLQTTAPYCYRCPVGKAYPDCGIACLGSAEAILKEHGEEIAALIVEPLVLGAGGLVTYPAPYLEKLIAMCRARGVLVIFDEVFTGFGRTGTLFAQDSLHEKPDFVCLSKGLTSGMMPLGATVVAKRVFEAFVGGERRKLYHGHTFTANGLGCALALASLRLFDEEGTLERNVGLANTMTRLGEGLRALPYVGDVRQLGMIWACEIVTDRNLRVPFQPANGPGWSMARALWKKGIWIRPMGQTLYCVPPYCSTESDLQRFFELLYSEAAEAKHYSV